MSSDELVRWGLHLLEVPDRHHQHHQHHHHHHHHHDGHDAGCSSSSNCSCSSSETENDEALARRLQEEFYLEESTTSGATCATTGTSTTSGSEARRERSDPEIGDFFSKEERAREVCGDCGSESMGQLSSRPVYHEATSSGINNNNNNNNNNNENDEAIAVVLSEELAQLDGEVGRRLTHMESIPHVPKINGEIPDADAATLDHQRLLERLQVYGLTEHKIHGDGNCQFRALSDQFYRTPDHHMFVRKEVIKHLKQDPEPYEFYVPMKFSDYLKNMAKSGEWGDHVTLQAAADAYGMKICLITSFRDTCIIDIVPKQPKSERVIFLSFWAEVHYNSVYPEGEFPVSYQVSKKKKHWFSSFC